MSLLRAKLNASGLTEAEIVEIVATNGDAVVGSGEAAGQDRAVKAAHTAIAQLEADGSIERARGILVNVHGGNDLSLLEVNEAAEAVHQATSLDAELLFGCSTDLVMAGRIRVTVVAVGRE